MGQRRVGRGVNHSSPELAERKSEPFVAVSSIPLVEPPLLTYSPTYSLTYLLLLTYLLTLRVTPPSSLTYLLTCILTYVLPHLPTYLPDNTASIPALHTYLLAQLLACLTTH